jgi:hypothetical protein
MNSFIMDNYLIDKAILLVSDKYQCANCGAKQTQHFKLLDKVPPHAAFNWCARQYITT